MYSQKYTKYKNKNEKIGGGIKSLLSVASKVANKVDIKKAVMVATKAKQAVKKGSDKVIMAANKASDTLKKIKKEIEKEKTIITEATDKESYDILIKSIDSLIQILASNSMIDILNKKTEIVQLINTANEIIQKSPVKQSDKDAIKEIIELMNIIAN
jgi:hypothetical protein